MTERLRRLNLAQRIVVVAALAAMFRVVGGYVLAEWVEYPDGGWSAYVPLSDHIPSAGARPFVATLVWLVCALLWGAMSVWLLGLPGDDARDDSSP